jgi:hypothetical protein
MIRFRFLIRTVFVYDRFRFENRHAVFIMSQSSVDAAGNADTEK